MPRIALVVHPARPAAVRLAAKTREWWEAHGYEVVDLGLPEAAPADDQVAIDLAISLGGDGTMLRTVELASPLGAPVIGVNLGRMGYLTEVEPAGLEAAFERFASGEYEVAERMTLAVTVTRGGREEHGLQGLVALNEVTLEKIAPGHTIRFDVSIAGRPFLTYAADGVIVATPTGSTAYNLSARGPIVSPSLRAMVLTPISPHMLFDRSLVLDPGEWVKLELQGTQPGTLVVDGTPSMQLGVGDTVTARAADTAARIVTFGRRDFHAILRGKFGLTDR